MKFKLFKKATDKPIEIFIALFIILAVAMVILRMFSSQITGKQDEISEIERQQRLSQAEDDAKDQCAALCQQTKEASCNLQSQAQFCIAKVRTKGEGSSGLDLNGNEILNEYNSEYLAGIGICEDTIYCSQLSGVECVCGGKLTMKNCLSILCQYWEEEFDIDDTEGKLTEQLNQYIYPGACADDAPEGKGWWDIMGNITCS